MTIFILLISIFVFCDTIGYAIYEFKHNSNKLGGISIIIISIIALFLPTFISLIR